MEESQKKERYRKSRVRNGHESTIWINKKREIYNVKHKIFEGENKNKTKAKENKGQREMMSVKRVELKSKTEYLKVNKRIPKRCHKEQNERKRI